jgi:hypothetical protein
MSAKKSRGLYARVMGEWHSHPKVLVASMEARGLWVTVASWCTQNRTDGCFSTGHASALAQGRHAKPLRELVTCGLVDDLGDGRYRLHDWDQHNMTRADHEHWKAADAERKRVSRSVRKGGSVRADIGRTSGGHRQDSERSHAGVTLESHSHAPKEGSDTREGGYPYSDADREYTICGPSLLDADEVAW